MYRNKKCALQFRYANQTQDLASVHAEMFTAETENDNIFLFVKCKWMFWIVTNK